MKISFYKYQGTGNDFIMIDNRENVFPHDLSIISKLCDRKFGIGADGLILIEQHHELDFEMIYFNADGSKSLCGNGSRCAVMFAHQLEIVNHETNFLTIDGHYQALIQGEIVHLKMRDQKKPEKINDHYFLHNGSPHHIEFVKEASQAPVFTQGSEIRYSATYAPEGTNVNFVEIKNSQTIFVRTYERGVEDETLSCGTGITASALAAADRGLASPVAVEAKGGKLEVKFTQTKNQTFDNIWLIGPAKLVYQGEVSI